ncbi:MAG: 30S ribosomal protein S4 [Nanoarchaeota archaeon]
MPLKQHKKYSRPRKPFDKARIDNENILREKYGLKNKREIWKADASIGRIRNLAKQLITKSEKEKQDFIKRLQEKGFNVNSIAEALSLNKEDWLKRRLQTIVFSKKLTTTPKQARQLIAHKHVSVGDRTVNIPSYMVSLEEEPLIQLKIALKIIEPKKSKEEKIKQEMEEEKLEEETESVNPGEVIEEKILEETS